MSEQPGYNPELDAVPEPEKNEKLLRTIAAFQAKFLDLTYTDFSDPNNLFIFSDLDRSKKAQFIKAYSSGRGFNAHIGKGILREKEDESLAIDAQNRKTTWVNVPIVQDTMDDFHQTWEFGQEAEAAEVAGIVAKGITVDEDFLNQIVTVKKGSEPDAPVFQTFRDLLLDLTRLEIIRNERIQPLIGAWEGDRAREIRVRRPQALSLDELKLLTLHRVGEQARADIEQGTPQGLRVMRDQVVQMEAQLALVMMDRFSTASSA